MELAAQDLELQMIYFVSYHLVDEQQERDTSVEVIPSW